MTTKPHLRHIYVKNKSPKATQNVMNPCLISPLHQSTACDRRKDRKKGWNTDRLNQKVPAAFKLTATIVPSQ